MPASGSLAGDDSVNVIVGTAEGNIYVFNPVRSNEPIWTRTLSGNLNAPVSLADLDEDGKLEYEGLTYYMFSLD